MFPGIRFTITLGIATFLLGFGPHQSLHARETADLMVVWKTADVTNPNINWLSVEEFDEGRNRWKPARGVLNPVIVTNLKADQKTFYNVPTNVRLRIKDFSAAPPSHYSSSFRIHQNSRFHLWGGQIRNSDTNSLRSFLKWLFK